MEKVTGTVSGKLVIGASMIPGEYMVPQLLARFKKAYPDVFPILRIADSNDIYESVLQSEICDPQGFLCHHAPPSFQFADLQILHRVPLSPAIKISRNFFCYKYIQSKIFILSKYQCAVSSCGRLIWLCRFLSAVFWSKQNIRI